MSRDPRIIDFEYVEQESLFPELDTESNSLRMSQAAEDNRLVIDHFSDLPVLYQEARRRAQHQGESSMDNRKLQIERAKAEHRLSVIEAIRRGERVPRIVLDQYPDLAKYQRLALSSAAPLANLRPRQDDDDDPFYEGVDRDGPVDGELVDRLHNHGLHVGQDCTHGEFLHRLRTALRTSLHHRKGKPPEGTGMRAGQEIRMSMGSGSVRPDLLDRITGGKWSQYRAKQKAGGK